MPSEAFLVRGRSAQYRKVGVTANRWYIAGVIGATALTTVAASANVLRAIPFLVARTITLDQIAINVTTLIAGKARLGIYLDDGTIYPEQRLLDAGEVDTGTTGVKALSINQTLTTGLYWLVHVANAAPTLRAVAVGGLLPILGIDSGIGTAFGVGYSRSYTYAALPDPFGAGATVMTGTQPAICVRLSQ